MKNICVSLALITLLGGCGSKIEKWDCNPENGQAGITLDFENKTMLFGNKDSYEFQENGNKIIWQSYGFTLVLDRDTGDVFYDGQPYGKWERCD